MRYQKVLTEVNEEEMNNIQKPGSAFAEHREIQDHFYPEPWVSCSDAHQDEAVTSSQFIHNQQTLNPSTSIRQLEFVPNGLLSPSSTTWNNRDHTALRLNPQTSSVSDRSVTKPGDELELLSAFYSPNGARTISEVTITGLHQTPYEDTNTKTSILSEVLFSSPQRQLDSIVSNITPKVRRSNFVHVYPHSHANRGPIIPITAAECDAPKHEAPSQLEKNTGASSCRGAQTNTSPLPSAHGDKESGYSYVPQTAIVQGASDDFPDAALIPGGALQTAQRSICDIDGQRRRTLSGGAVVQRVLKRIAKTNADIPETFVRLQGLPMHQDTHASMQTADDEEQGQKRKDTAEKNEEELKRIRRVRNRESVEKCRAKQKLRLEKLENEEKALRAECILMRQVAKSVQRNWEAVALEFERITREKAGECPMIIPSDVGVVDMSTTSNWSGEIGVDISERIMEDG